MLDAETLQRIRRIELRMRRIVNASFAGAYHAVFKGRGMVFDAVQPYWPGDDVRTIDWYVTARTGEPFVKRYIEDRDLTLMILVDASASLAFATTRPAKRDIAAEIGAALALMAIANNDRAGMLVFADRIEQYVPPRKGRNHVLRLIRDLLVLNPGGGTDLALALRTAQQVLRRRSILFIISDFLAPVETYAPLLMLLGQRHDVIALILSDPLERDWPEAGLVALRDLETDETHWIDSDSVSGRNQFANRVSQQHAARDRALTQAGVDRVLIPPDGDYLMALSTFFQRRARRLK